MGSIVPISFEACIIETKIVSGFMAASTSLGFTVPYLSTGIFVQFVNYSSSDFGKCSEQTDIGLFDLHLMISYSVNIRLFNIA